MATITIADYLAQILETGGRPQQTGRQPTAADWASGINPSTLNQPPFGAGAPVDYGALGSAAEELEYGMAYGGLPGALEQAALYSDPNALAGLTVRGRGDQPGLRDIAGELGVRGRSTMRKEQLISAITGAAPSAADLGTELGRFGGTDIALMQSRMTPSGAGYATGLMGGRQELYAQSQALFGFGAQNVDVALERAGISWQQVSDMTPQEVSTVLHGPVANEFMARGGARTFPPPESGGQPVYFSPRARADVDAEMEGGAGESYAARLSPSAPRAALPQSWMLQRGRSPGGETQLGPQEFYRGAGLVGQVSHLLQEPGIAGIMGEGGGVESLVAGDPAKVAKRLSQLSQEHGIRMTGLPAAQSRVLGQAAKIPETVQPARAWVSMGEWMAQGSGLYGTHLGRPYAELTRRLRLPKGAEVTAKPGQRFAGGERVPVFGGHVGLEFGKSYEEIIVQSATAVKKFTEKGDPYQEVQFQALGMMPTGTLVAGKHELKAGMTGSDLPTKMGVDVVLPPNELYQLGALVGSAASPELAKEIWGEEAGRWGPKSGKQFADWLQGPKSPLEERLLPAQTFDPADPVTQRMAELGRLVHPTTGEVLTKETLGSAQAGQTGAITARLKDIGFEADVGLRLSMVFSGKTQMIKPEAFMAIAEQHPRLAHELFRGGLRHQAEMSHILGAVAAEEDPESEMGRAFIEKAVPMTELGKQYPQFLQRARDVMTESGIEAPEDQPDVLQGITMGLVGEAYKGRGISMEGEEGTRYLPNMAILGRKFGYPFQENVLNQLPRQAAQLMEYEAARSAGGRQYIPAEAMPEGKSPEDYTPEELATMERKYRTGRVEAAAAEFGEATSSKETLMSLLGVRAGKYMVSAHPTAEPGVAPSRYVTSERQLRKMVVAPGASEEEREELLQQIQAGEVEGPRLAMVGYPIVDPGQAKQVLGYTPREEALERGIAPSAEEFEERFAGRVGVSALGFYSQEKDLDVDEMLRMVGTKYGRTEEGGWRAEHMARQSTTQDILQMTTKGAISGELGRHLEKLEERSTMGGVREWITSQTGAEPATVEQLQTKSEDKALGGITKGMMFNVFARRISGRMRGEPETEAARRTVATPFQTALDLAEVKGGWKGILERMYTFDIATKGWSSDWSSPSDEAEGGEERKGKPHHVRTMGEWADVNIRDVLSLKGMKDQPIDPQHLASMLLRPSAGRERWEKLTTAIGEQQAGAQGTLGDIRELVLGGADLGTAAGLQQVYEESPLLGAGLEAAAFRAVEKGTAGIGEKKWRTTAKGAKIGQQLSEYEAWLSERGGEVKGYIGAMSPQTHLDKPPSLYQRFQAVQKYATGHPAVSPALRASVERVSGLAGGVSAAAPAAEAMQEAVSPTVPPPPPPLTPRTEASTRFAQMQAEFEAAAPEEQATQRADSLALDPNGGYEFGAGDPARGAQGARRPLTEVERAPHEDVTEGLTWSDPLGIARALRKGMRPTDQPPAAAAGGVRPPTAPPPSAGRYSLGQQPPPPPPPPPAGAAPAPEPEAEPQAFAAVKDLGLLGEAYPSGFRIVQKPGFTGVFPADPSAGETTPEEYRMRASMVQRAMGVQVSSPAQRASQIARLGQAGVTGAALTGITRMQTGQGLTTPQAAAIMGATGYAPAVQQEVAAALGGVPGGGTGRGARGGGAADALEKFTETVESARGHLEKYGDEMKEQLDLFQQGRLRMGDKAAWGRDVRAMVGMGRGIVGQAEALGQPVPEGLAGDVAGWQDILGAAGGAGMGGGIGRGFEGAQRGGRLDPFIPSGRSMYAGGLGQLAWGMFNMQRLWRYTGGQVTKAMGQYVGYQAQQQQAMAGLGIGEGYGGDVTDMMSGQAAMERAKLGFGRAAWETWGFVPRALGKVDAKMEPNVLQRAGTLAPLAAPPVALGMASAMAKGMGLTGLAGGLGLAGTLTGYAGVGLGLAAAGVYGTNVALEKTGVAGQIAGAQERIAGEGRFYPGVPGMQTFLPGAEQLDQAPSAGVQAFQQASAELQREFEGLTPQGADQAIAAYGRTTGRTPEMADWSAEDIQAAGGMSRFAPALQAEVGGGAAQLAGAAGISMGQPEMAGFVERYRQLGPAERRERGQVAGLLEPLQQQFLQATGQRAPVADVWEMDIPQATRAAQLGQGAQLPWSRLGLEQGRPEFVTTQPETGMPVGTTWGGGILAQGMQAGRFQMGEQAGATFERELQAGNIVINAEEATLTIGGKQVPFTQQGLQDYSQQLQRAQQGRQFEQQATGLAARYAYTTGGTMEGAPAGAPDFGRGQWAIQDAMTAAQRGYQTTQFGFQREQLGMQDRQFNERWQQQAQRSGVQYQWGQQDIGTQWARTQKRFQWGEEDIAYKGAQSTMQYGWGQEDIQERMRYATGRERRQLMKQQERATVSYAMGMGRLDTESGRLDERRKWAEEDHRRTRSRFEQRYRWSRQDMDLQKRHHEEQMSLAKRRQGASEEYFNQTNALQDEMREASREYWEFQFGQQKTALEQAETLWEQLNTIGDLQADLATAMQQQTSWFAAQFMPDGGVNKAWHGLVGDMLSGIGALRSAAMDYRRYLSSNPYSSMSSHK